MSPSALVEGVDSVAPTVAGHRRHLGGIVRGLRGGVLETINDFTDFLKSLAFGQLFDFLSHLHLFLQSAMTRERCIPSATQHQ